MVNEHGKVSNLNVVICGEYVHRRKKLMDKGQRKFGSPFNLGDFPFKIMKLPRMMVRFMKVVHVDISQTFSNFYQGIVRPYRGTMSGIMFFKHVFYFSVVEKPVNDTFVVVTHILEISAHSL